MRERKMIDTLERTRFLSELDNMVMRDERGAIDDMLQILRELGVVRQAGAQVPLIDKGGIPEPAYIDHCKRRLSVEIAYLLYNGGHVSFKEEIEDQVPFRSKLVGTASFVMSRK